MLGKMIVLGVVFLFVGMTMSVMSSDSKKNVIDDCVSCNGVPIYVGDETYYVMDYILESPVEDLSVKPTVTRSLPSYFSWKDVDGLDFTTSAKNQGACGSCWAFGAMSALEGVIDIAWDDPDLNVDTAEQYILSCLPMSGSCGGGDSLSAFKLILSELATGNYVNGIITEDCFPYQANSNIPCSEKCDEWENKLIPLVDCGYWHPDFPEDIDAIKAEIMDKGPVVTYFQATGDFSRFFSNNHDPDDYYPFVEGSGANHAVSIVGWKDDPDIGNGGYWIVKNSWGTSWGYDGFFNMEYGCLNIDNVQISWVEYDPAVCASFEFSPTNALAGDDIQFYDTTNLLGGVFESRLWDFSDGFASSDENPQHSFDDAGCYPVTLSITYDGGQVAEVMKNVFIGDQIAPETTPLFSGVEGDNGWYVSGVKINFSVFDEFSGVDYTLYSLDGKPFEEFRGQFTVYKEGEHTLCFYSVDNAGNVEAQQDMMVNIDRSDPLISVAKPLKGKLYVFNTMVLMDLRESVIIGPIVPLVDTRDNISEVNRVEFYLNHELVFEDVSPPFSCVVSGSEFGHHCILAMTVVDNAGRTRTEKVPFIFYGFGVLDSFLSEQ